MDSVKYILFIPIYFRLPKAIMKQSTQNNFVERLKAHSALRSRFESILDLAENTSGDVITANEAERQAIEEVRQLGNEVLQDWATQRVEASANELKDKEKNVKGNGKKKIAWHTTFGDVELQERLFIRPGKQYRPFSTSAGIYNRGCSLPLQRVIVDFCADHAFGRVSEKLKEHYGITIATSTIQALTEKHANKMSEPEKEVQTIPDKAGCRVQIGFITGSMIPIVNIDEEAIDSRKNKTLLFQCVRLSIAHEQGSITPTVLFFRAMLMMPDNVC